MEQNTDDVVFCVKWCWLACAIRLELVPHENALCRRVAIVVVVAAVVVVVAVVLVLTATCHAVPRDQVACSRAIHDDGWMVCDDIVM